ncbi:hypothetical protein ACG93R_12425 [Acinetobacter guillouiae]|uniref:hypothetical protein n=1 Tax=Acinetobacter guillouiae TaxID=106649 RepID=UPI003AF46F44
MSFARVLGNMAAQTANAKINIDVSFSQNKDIEETQKKVEEIKIHEAVKNTVNVGNYMKNESGKVEWENCIIHYRPVTGNLHKNNELLAKITMKDGTVLYESLLKISDGTKTRYTEVFRFGKWVERFLKNSEELSEKYNLEIEESERKMKEEQIKPFSEIDF